MVYSCNFGSATFITRGNRSRHQHKIHPDDVGLPVYNCSLYVFNSRKLSELEQHMPTCIRSLQTAADRASWDSMMRSCLRNI